MKRAKTPTKRKAPKRKPLGERLIEAMRQAVEWSKGNTRAYVHTFHREGNQIVRTTLFCTGPELKELEIARKRG